MKTIKEIHVDANQCNGCLSCEMGCAASHAVPPYGSSNPARSRITVVMDEARDVYLPIRAAEFAQAECMGRVEYVIDGKEYGECSFCPASCPSRSRFMDPVTGLPMVCDMCESLDVEEPICVQVCHPGALTYVERQVAVEDEHPAPRSEAEVGVEYLARRHGLHNLLEAAGRAAKRRR